MNPTKLAFCRKAANLTQAEVADRLQVTQGSVSHWERGSRPLQKYRRQLADLYGVPEDELFSDGSDQH